MRALAVVGWLVVAVEGVPDKKALAGLKEAKKKLDELYREVMGRKAGNLHEEIGSP